MDHRPKHKSWNYNTLRRKHRSKSPWLCISRWFLRYDTKSTVIKFKKPTNWISSKLKAMFFNIYCQESKMDAHRKEEILTNHISDKEVIFRIYKNTYNLILKR